MASKTKMRRRANGEGAFIKRRNHYYLRQTISNHRVELSLKNEDGTLCTTEAQAIAAAKRLDRTVLELDTKEKVVAKVAELRQLKVEHTAQTADVWQLYVDSANRPDTAPKALQGQHTLLERFGKWMLEHFSSGLDGTTPTAASKFMHELGESVSNRTFNGYLGILRLIFETVHEQLGMPENPFAKIRRRPLETFSRKEFTEAQVRTIFAGFKDGFFYDREVKRLRNGEMVTEKEHLEFKPMHREQMAVLMKLCCFSGCDGQSGCLMRWDNVDLQANRLDYVRNKTRKKTGGRLISLPIHPVLREALLKAQQWKKDDSPYILPDVAERYKRNHYGVQEDVRMIIRCALGVDTTFHGDTGTKRALAPSQYSLHSFRHTFVSFCANAGVPLAVVAEIVGHGNPAMTRHYAHIHDDAKQSAIDVLPALSSPSQSEKDDTSSKPDSEDALRQKISYLINSASPEQLQNMVDSLSAAPPKRLIS